jgi:UDP-3-O-[3-hydroxymyristoyl] N-acetylglucosamine deacetylase
MNTIDKSSIVYKGIGVTSKKNITVEIIPKPKGHGIVFQLENKDTHSSCLIPAKHDYVVNTLRNVVLGIENNRLCIVEHFLAATSLLGLDDLLVIVDGPEMPLADGSAQVWIDLFQKNNWQQNKKSSHIILNDTIMIKKHDRALIAIADDSFSMTYMMDWDHKAIGKRWQTWTADMEISEIAQARTFGSMQEHKLLGIEDQISLTNDGFSKELHFEDEPVRHKLLDLIGDLSLAGVNPMEWKARFISIKGGHELDVELAKRLHRHLPK